jgi:hypothetical protein
MDTEMGHRFEKIHAIDELLHRRVLRFDERCALPPRSCAAQARGARAALRALPRRPFALSGESLSYAGKPFVLARKPLGAALSWHAFTEEVPIT